MRPSGAGNIADYVSDEWVREALAGVWATPPGSPEDTAGRAAFETAVVGHFVDVPTGELRRKRKGSTCFSVLRPLVEGVLRNDAATRRWGTWMRALLTALWEDFELAESVPWSPYGEAVLELVFDDRSQESESEEASPFAQLAPTASPRAPAGRTPPAPRPASGARDAAVDKRLDQLATVLDRVVDRLDRMDMPSRGPERVPRPRDEPVARRAAAPRAFIDQAFGRIDDYERAVARDARRRPRAADGDDDEDDDAGRRSPGRRVDRTTLRQRFARVAQAVAQPQESLLELAAGLDEREDDWPFAPRPRLAPTVLPEMSKTQGGIIAWADAWVNDPTKGVKGTTVGFAMKRYALALHHALTYDAKKMPGFNPLNSAMVEVIVRDMYGLQKAYAGVDREKAKAAKTAQQREEYEPKWSRRDAYDFARDSGEICDPEADEEVQRAAIRKSNYDKALQARGRREE